MKSLLKQVDDHGLIYQALMFVCPGCVEEYTKNTGSTGLHILAVNSLSKSPSWNFDGNLELPTLSPSILTRHGEGRVCHSFLKAGMFEFLTDCTHSLAGQKVLIPDLPEWVLIENEQG